jgi:hypothetical protein
MGQRKMDPFEQREGERLDTSEQGGETPGVRTGLAPFSLASGRSNAYFEISADFTFLEIFLTSGPGEGESHKKSFIPGCSL